jgi:hypothetical protein
MVDESLQFFLDDIDEELEATALYFTRKNRLHFDQHEAMIGSIEVVVGSGEELCDLLYISGEAEVKALTGRISEPDYEDGKMSFSTQFYINSEDFKQEHILFETQHHFSIYLRFLQGHSEIDIKEIEDAFSKASISSPIIAGELGTFLPMQFVDDQIEFRIGNRKLLKS